MDDIASLLVPQQQAEPAMGALAMVRAARQQLATQPQRLGDLAAVPGSAVNVGAFGTATPQEQADVPPNILDKIVAGGIGSLASLSKRAIEGAAAYQPGSGKIPEGLVGASLEAAMLPMGTGAIAGVPVRAGEAVLGAGPIRAYHGSPHDFDKFSLDKIGTGEGAQAYGHGLYFAENPGVAESYKLAGQPGYISPATHGSAKVAMDEAGGDMAKARDILHGKYLDAVKSGDHTSARNYQDAGNNIDTLLNHTPGRMYEVNINADPEHFLDWDKPLSEQHPQVKQQLADVYPELQGDTVARAFPYGIRPQITEALNKSGIPGIKYLDQGSRASGEGSRNYVVFDDKLVDIARKYGMGSLAALPPAVLGAVQSTDGRQ